jgi:hypothetical protein
MVLNFIYFLLSFSQQKSCIAHPIFLSPKQRCEPLANAGKHQLLAIIAHAFFGVLRRQRYNKNSELQHVGAKIFKDYANCLWFEAEMGEMVSIWKFWGGQVGKL